MHPLNPPHVGPAVHLMNAPIPRGDRAFASCACGWGEWVPGVKLEEYDQDLDYSSTAADAWIVHMEAL